ncbi:MAG: cation diffusion facilitator family transporter [Parahaliea sp.]
MSEARHHHNHHDHTHVPSVSGDNERKVLISFCLIFTFMIVEVIGGLLSGSLALLADAGHMLTDAAALALAYAAFRFGRRGADTRRTFGYLRFEVIAALINAVTLLLIVIWIAYEAWERFQTPRIILAGPMLGVAILGLLVNILVFWILTRGDSEHVNIKGAAVHVMGDLLGSVGAVLAAIVIYFSGWSAIDPILSVLVSLLILRSAWKLLLSSINILLEGAPENMAPQEIEAHLLDNVPNLAAVSHIHIWLITSGHVLATLHIRPQDNTQARTVVKSTEQTLAAHFGIEHATIAIDWNDEGASCNLTAQTHATIEIHKESCNAHNHNGAQ